MNSYTHNCNTFFWRNYYFLCDRSWVLQLIDPYWTIIPVMMGYFYGTRPGAESDVWRSRAVMSLLWLWSIRLTHSYFRRENWQWGEREDWRFAQLRSQHSRHWWWMSFFAVYVSQQVSSLHPYIFLPPMILASLFFLTFENRVNLVITFKH